MKVLIIAPHPDDESIGCGGTLCLHARRGDPMAVVYLTSGELGLKHFAARTGLVGLANGKLKRRRGYSVSKGVFIFDCRTGLQVKGSPRRPRSFVRC